MRELKSEIRRQYFVISILLFAIPGFLLSQDSENYSEFRKEIASLTLDYKLEEALALCNKSNESDREVIAATSAIYSLMGNMDKNESYIEKGFTLLNPYQSRKDDYNIHVAFAISYGIQANHSGLKEKTKLAQLSVNHCKEALKLNTGAAYNELKNKEKALHYFHLADKNVRHTEDDRKADKDLQKQIK